MPHRLGSPCPFPVGRLLACAAAGVLAMSVSFATRLAAQDAAQPGASPAGWWTRRGRASAGAQVFLLRPAVSAQTGSDGRYALDRVPAGTQVLHVRMLGFAPDSASVTVSPAAAGDAGLHPAPRPAPAPGDGRHRHADAAAEPRGQRGGHDAHRAGGGAGRAPEHHRDAALRARASPGWRAPAAKSTRTSACGAFSASST